MGATRHPQAQPDWLPVWLTRQVVFPEASLADPEGMVAVGGDFSVARLVAAYRQGIFPWSADPITWWSPDPRAIIELDRLHIPRSLKPLLRNGTFTVTLNRAFEAVITACAQPGPTRHGTWITREFIDAYCALHRSGHAHSLEVWQNHQLAGGIYGVSQGGLFAGESMFHRIPNASKVALVRLVEHLRSRKFTLFDVQMLTPVTQQMGGIEIPRQAYLNRLKSAVRQKRAFL